jgi:hypothetical protein
MSSLRLALKQSLQESGGFAPKKTKERKPRPPSTHASNLSSSSNTNNSGSVPPRRKRRPGDPPRKRGRPRKHPLPEEPKDEKEEQEVPRLNDNHNEDAENSSDENEFSDFDSFEEMGDESEQTNHRKDHYKDDADDEAHEDDNGEGEQSITEHDEIAARKNHRKLLKKMKQQDMAANTIQRKMSEWTKKKVVAKPVSRPVSPKPAKKSQSNEPPVQSFYIEGKPKRSVKGIVPAPAPEILDWIASMSIKKQRRHMSAGLRVKVRFATKVKKRDGKIVSKHKWYGGLVTAMSSGGSKIRIKYDDSTVEVAKYPDADIIVDDEDNASHQVPAGAFIPPLNSDDDNDMENSPSASVKSKIPVNTSRPADCDVPDDWKSEKQSVTSPRPKGFNTKPRRTRDVELTDDAATQDGTLSLDGQTEEVVQEGRENPEVPYEVSGHAEKAMILQGTHIEDDGSKAESDDDDDEEEEGSIKDGPRTMREREISNCTASTDEKISTDRQDNSDESSDDNGPLEIIAQGTGAEGVDPVATEEASDDECGIREQAQTMEVGNVFQAIEDQQTSFSPDAKASAQDSEHEARMGDDDGAVSDDGTVEDHVESVARDAEQEGRSDDEDDDVATSEVKGALINDYKEPGLRLHEKRHDINPRALKRKKEPTVGESTSRSSTPSDSITSKPRRESPLIILSEFKKESLPRELTKPVSKVARSVEAGAQGDVLKPDSPRIGSSQNSAFDKKEKQSKERREKQPKDSHQTTDDDLYSLTPNQDSGDQSLIQRSGRRAAQQANERIASRQELIIAETLSKPKKKKIIVDKPETKQPGKKRKDSDHGVDGTDGENQWVQCDKCAKWRVLPSTVDVDKLPNQWYCEMNIYDPLHNSCDATEQTPEEIAKAKRKAKRRLVRRARLEAEAAASAAASLGDVVEEPKEKEIEKEKEKEVKPKITKSPAPEKRKREEKPVDEVKKRETPPLNNSDDEGKHSSGSYSDSDQKDSKKARRSRSDDGLVEVIDGVKGKARGRIRRGKDGKDDKTKGRKVSNKGKEDNQEWVQCEKCEKWRRLPPNISADDLPDVWYCTMNTWDPNTSTCGAAEDKADPSSHIVPGFGVQGGHKLSYRSLIFGTGKKQHRPISERMRAAESLFSSHSYTDPDTAGSHPTVMYANSSVFINRSNAARAAEDRKGDRQTFLEAMSHSNLWAELRGRNRRLNEQAACKTRLPYASGGADVSLSSLPNGTKQRLKEMVHYALGTATMASHEVLLEAQCRPWEGVPSTWTELRAICTIEMIVACLIELVEEGRVEAVPSTSPHRTVLEVMPRYRRVSASSQIPTLKSEEDHLPATRLMKIAKPWKHGLSY